MFWLFDLQYLKVENKGRGEGEQSNFVWTSEEQELWKGWTADVLWYLRYLHDHLKSS